MMKKVADILKKKIGSNKVKTDKEFCISYSYDATGIKSNPDIVVFPASESDVESILKTASMYKIPVTPRGSGVGYSGGSVPVKGGIVIVFSKMNRILEIDESNMLIVAEPGVITADIIKQSEESGLFYPPDPASMKNSTIGGNVSENAGGPRCFKYGVTSDYVLCIEGFLINGMKVKFGSRSIKDVAGYDLKKIISGSEGTLIVITKIILRLIPKPEKRVLVYCGFSSLRGGTEFILKIVKMNISPSVLEFIDKTSLDAIRDYMVLGKSESINSVVLMELDGNYREIKNKIKTIKEEAYFANIEKIVVAETEKEIEELWSIRRNLSPAISKLKPKKINEDIAVPIGEIPGTIEYISQLSKKYDIKIIMFGHLGDGNIHTNIMVDPSSKREMKNSKIVLDRIFKHVISVHGTITGEHGIGLSKKEFLSYQFNKAEIELFRKIKKAFDPHNLLNPEKIF